MCKLVLAANVPRQSHAVFSYIGYGRVVHAGSESSFLVTSRVPGTKDDCACGGESAQADLPWRGYRIYFSRPVGAWRLMQLQCYSMGCLDFCFLFV